MSPNFSSCRACQPISETCVDYGEQAIGYWVERQRAVAKIRTCDATAACARNGFRVACCVVAPQFQCSREGTQRNKQQHPTANERIPRAAMRQRPRTHKRRQRQNFGLKTVGVASCAGAPDAHVRALRKKCVRCQTVLVSIVCRPQTNA